MIREIGQKPIRSNENIEDREYSVIDQDGNVLAGAEKAIPITAKRGSVRHFNGKNYRVIHLRKSIPALLEVEEL